MKNSPVINAASANAGVRPRSGGRPRSIAFLAAILAVIGVGVWWLVTRPGRELRSAERLLADAYARHRTYEFRLPDASYSPVRAEAPDGPAFSRPFSLLEAESQIAHHLAKDHDSADWLRLRARAEMINDEAESAIATLQRALEQSPDAPDLLAELGMAYALRADAQNRDVDLGYAIDYLCRGLKAKPDSPVAAFNRAVVYERTYLYEDAITEWRHYLELDPAGGWHDEARRRLANLEDKKEARLRKLAQISDKDPDVLLGLVDAGQPIDAESYLDVAIVEWLPLLGQDAKYERALRELATRFEDQHRDRWLRDVLAMKTSSGLIQGLTFLSDAVRANLADESDRALAKSVEAANRLRAAGARAGVLRAEFEQVYALHRTVRSASGCAEKAADLEQPATARGYSWIVGQAFLEVGNCRSLLGDLGEAQNDINRGLQFIRGAGYADLELRAAGILADLQTEAGNLLAAWGVGHVGLGKYWKGPFSGIRAQQIYLDLMRSAEGLGLRQTAYAFGNAGVLAIAETPRRRTEALFRAYFAQRAMEAGWPDKARNEFDRAGGLFDQLPQPADREYRTLAEINRAQADIAGGDPQMALQRLEPIRPSAENVGAALTRIRFREIQADSLRLSGRANEAEGVYREAIDMTEDQLRTLRELRERAQLLLAASKAYRGLLELLCDRGDLTEGWRVWESFRAAGQLEQPGDLEQRRLMLRNESFLSYVILSHFVVAWVFDDRGIQGWRLQLKPEELETIASRFLRECSDAASDRQSLERDGRLLYDELVLRATDRLDPNRNLVIEPDGAVGAIPMQALIDRSSHYLGERFAITAASGLIDYQIRAAAGPVAVHSKALVVADPLLGAKTKDAFPVLPEAMREGRSIAERFEGSVLLAGQDATLAALERYRPNTELFHFAGHGFSDAGNGGLLLSPNEDDREGAGVLDGNAMARQDWSRCRLAVLSACSTGTGETRGPVNPESLVRGLLWAGVARVIASRWNTDSETSMRLMNRFYGDLLIGDQVAVALQNASRSVREDHATSHPFYWAAFQNFGTR